ncbi:hypothetical protein AOLI_G00064580 [Acnodon oligacanthus]
MQHPSEWNEDISAAEPRSLGTSFAKAHLISLSFAPSCRGNPEVTTQKLGEPRTILTPVSECSTQGHPFPGASVHTLVDHCQSTGWLCFKTLLRTPPALPGRWMRVDSREKPVSDQRRQRGTAESERRQHTRTLHRDRTQAASHGAPVTGTAGLGETRGCIIQLQHKHIKQWRRGS